MFVILVYARLSLDVMDQKIIGVIQDDRVLVLERQVGSYDGIPAVRLLLLMPLVIESLNLVQQRFGTKVSDIRLFEQKALVVKGFEVILFILVAPNFVEILKEKPGL